MDASSASLLDVPAQLAFVFSKLDDWEPINNDIHVVSVDGVTLNVPGHSLPSDIDDFKLLEYARLHCKDTLSAVSSAPLSEPILFKHNQNDFNESLSISKLLYRYLYDNTSPVRQRVIADFIVQYALTNDNLQDEILVQLCNLTFNVSWRPTNEEYTRRAWSLMLHFLSSFKPTASLRTYLLKYVSDHGFNGFESLAQHKLLDGMSGAKRAYPPSLLEWRANQTRAAMAILATFADGYAQHGHVTSFTTSEQFVYGLLSARHVKSGLFGWTVALHRDEYIYESDGFDYILDLIGEMDVVPSFPCCLSYLLISCRDSSQQNRQSQYGNSSRVDILRLTKLDVDEIPEPVVPVNEDEESDMPLLSTNSALNARYVIPRHSPAEDTAYARQFSTLATAGPEMDKWLENVFNHALGEPTDDFGENDLTNRLKGGGDKQTQAQPRTVLNAPASNQQSDPATWSTPSVPQYGFSQPFGVNSTADSSSSQAFTLNRAPGNVISQPLNSSSADGTVLPQTLILNGAAAGTFLSQTFNPNGVGNGGGLQPVASSNSSSLVSTGFSPPVPTVYPPTFVTPAGASVPLGKLQISTAEQLLQQQIIQQQQWQLQRENINLLTQLENQQLRNELLRQKLQQQQQLQPPQVPVLRNSATVIAVGDVTNPRPVLANGPSVVIVPDVAPSDTPTEPHRMIPARDDVALNAPSSATATNSSNQVAQMRSSNDVTAGRTTSEYRARDSELNREVVVARNRSPVGVSSKSETPKQLYVDNSSMAITTTPIIPPPSPPAPRPTLQQDVIDNRPGTTMNSVSSPLPPPAPPLPPPVQRVRNTAKPYVSNDVVVPVVRVGKIQWPPPRDDQERPTVQVGRFEIEEQTRNQTSPTKPPAENIRQKINERVADVQHTTESSSNERRPQQPIIERVAKVVEPTPIPDVSSGQPLSMQERQKTLEHQLKTSQVERTTVPTVQFPTAAPTAATTSQLTAENTSAKRESQTKLLTSALETTKAHQENQSTLVDLEQSDQNQRVAGPSHVEPDQLVDVKRIIFDLNTLEPVHTVLHDCNYRLPAVTYDNSAWMLTVRKQMFSPLETLDDDLLIDLIYTQIVSDVFSGSIRISRDDSNAIKSVLSSNGVSSIQIFTDQVSESFKLSVINTARSWPFYFSRLFGVNGGSRHSDVNLLSVNHTGVRLLARELQSINVIHYFRFNEIQEIRTPNSKTLQIFAASAPFVFYTRKAQDICDVIKALSVEAAKNARRVRAIETFSAQDATQLSFNKGDIITLPNTATNLKPGWLHGALHGRNGLFPADAVVGVRLRRLAPSQTTYSSSASVVSKAQAMSTIRGSFLDANNKYTMLEYAMSHFRQTSQRSQHKHVASDDGASQQTGGMKQSRSDEWTWREHVDLVKWTEFPIETSLTKLVSQANNKKAVECFLNIMRYMDDAVIPENTDTIGCALKVLSTCRQNDELRDEIYCQIMKQTTNNRSTKSDSCQQGWRLLLLISSYYRCSDSLLPYLMMYIQQTAFDKRRANYMLAKICLHNLHQTLKYGGRQTMPTNAELNALTHGKGPNQLVVSLPGGSPVRVSVNTSTVVCDIIDQICDELDVSEPLERREYTLFVINKNDDDYFPVPISAYMFDVITEMRNTTSQYFLLIQRTTWLYPLHLTTGNQIYINVMYQQLRPIYIDGYLLQTPQNKLPKQNLEELVYLAALQVQAADIKLALQQKDIEMYVPKNAMQMGDIKMSQWIHSITSQLAEIKELSRLECQVRFLEILSRWSLFGSTFFVIKRVTGLAHRSLNGVETILSVSKNGLSICSFKTHEVVTTLLFKELLSVRHHNEKAGGEFVDIKRTTTENESAMIQLYSDEAESIAAVICQYVKLLNTAAKSSEFVPI